MIKCNTHPNPRRTKIKKQMSVGSLEDGFYASVIAVEMISQGCEYTADVVITFTPANAMGKNAEVLS